jgi:hypothetical protein
VLEIINCPNLSSQPYSYTHPFWSYLDSIQLAFEIMVLEALEAKPDAQADN